VYPHIIPKAKKRKFIEYSSNISKKYQKYSLKEIKQSKNILTKSKQKQIRRGEGVDNFSSFT